VDIPGKQILRTSGGGVERWDMPSQPGCIAPALGGGWVMALRHGVFRARQWGGVLERVATLPYDSTAVRANDGKCDALGRFWVGTIDETKKAQSAALFSIDARRSGAALVQTQVEQALTANGLAWSLSGDSKPADWRFTDSTYLGRPDGAAVDAQGNYWVAMFEGARVCQFAPDGTLMAEIKTPAQCPTMPCFGGADLKTLFITTARHGRSEAELAHFPNSGCVFSLPVEVPGLAVNFFDDGA
jgi:sugar lactone lactonase YvrE